jgi:hypothetical protein
VKRTFNGFHTCPYFKKIKKNFRGKAQPDDPFAAFENAMMVDSGVGK